MILSDDRYVPALRWRQAEYQALFHLDNLIKDQVVPLICIPDVEFDFELWQAKRTVQEHVQTFPRRFLNKWGSRPAWITLNDKIAVKRMDDGTHVLDYILDALRPHHVCVIPAVPVAADVETLAAAQRGAAQDRNGVAIILRLEDLMVRNPKGPVVNTLFTVGVRQKDTDLVIDLRAPNFEPYAAFAHALVASLRKMGDLDQFRNLILISTAFPATFADVARGTDRIPRHDWLFYKEFLAALPSRARRPIYGDYTIVHPDFVAKDMRKIKAAGKVIYTTEDAWATRKGGAFRGNEDQMHDHCKRIVEESSFQFQGAAFSYGDEYIARCATRQEGHSNLSRWKCIGINHHITMVSKDLAKLAFVP